MQWHHSMKVSHLDRQIRVNKRAKFELEGSEATHPLPSVVLNSHGEVDGSSRMVYKYLVCTSTVTAS